MAIRQGRSMIRMLIAGLDLAALITLVAIWRELKNAPTIETNDDWSNE